MEWKKNQDNDYYIEHFQKEVLDTLDITSVVRDLVNLLPDRSSRHDISLICYEKPSDFCHRHLVANWLKENGFKCKEWEE